MSEEVEEGEYSADEQEKNEREDDPEDVLESEIVDQFD